MSECKEQSLDFDLKHDPVRQSSPNKVSNKTIPIEKQDPANLINNSLLGLNFSLSFDPLKEILRSICESQKVAKYRMDELVQDNMALK